MEELEALRKLVEEHDYNAALILINEMDEMAKDDKINKIESYIRILLIHIIKQQAEKRSTLSWENSIDYSLDGIGATNERKKSGGHYLQDEEIQHSIERILPSAIKWAAKEAFGGAFNAKILSEMIDNEAIKQEALDKILNYEI